VPHQILKPGYGPGPRAKIIAHPWSRPALIELTVIAESTRVRQLGEAGSTEHFLRIVWYCYHLLNRFFSMRFIGYR